MFVNPAEDIIIHSITLRADDWVDLSYTEKRHMHEWGYKTQIWSFIRTAVPDIELQQMVESASSVLDLVEIKSRQDTE